MQSMPPRYGQPQLDKKPPMPYPNISGGFNQEAPPALALTNQRKSSMNYSTKKARRQNWFNQFNYNKKIETEMLLKGFDLRKESRSYLLSIKSVSGIPMKDLQGDKPPVPGAKYNIEYYVTLFNKDIGANGNFYGRTYRSKPLALKEIGGQWEVAQEEFIFFHTSYNEKTSFAVVECVLAKELGGIKSYGSIGYGLCNIFEFKGASSVELIRGSPRSIGQASAESAQMRRGQVTPKMSFEMRDFPAFDKIKQLLPQNCFCGTNDVLPGLVNDCLPNPRGGTQGNMGQVNVQLLPKATIYIHNIQMICSIALENRFENFLRKMKQEKLKTARGSINTSQTDNVYISERRIIVSANNTWKNVNEETYVSMGPPNDKGISNSGGSLTIKNFICHPLISLVFRVEYKAILPTEKVNEQVYFTLGWVCHLPQFNAAGELCDETVEDEFQLGPGKAPSGDLLWDPNADDINYYQIKMKAVISTNAQAPSMPKDLHGMTQAQSKHQSQMFGGNHTIGDKSNPQLTIQQQAAVIEKEREIQRLQDMLNVQKNQAFEMQRRTEHLELDRLNDPNRAAGYDRNYEEQLRLVQMQKEQMQNQIVDMQNEMRSYMESMKDGIYNVRGAPQQYGNPYQQQNYGEQMHQQMSQPIQGDSASQIAMIGNVFYNMLNMIGDSEKDKRIIGLSDNIKKMVQQQRFDDLLAPKVPYVGMGQVNLLKTTDLPLTDQVNFIKMGFGDMLHHPSAQITSTSIMKDRLSLELEKADTLKASTVTFKFIVFKTPWNDLENLPQRFYFQLKFFTFPTVLTDKVRIKNFQNEGSEQIRPGQPYYLSKETHYGAYGGRTKTMNQYDETHKDTMHDPNLLSIVFEIDPSLSRIREENVKLAEYLKDRFLTVDVFDGDSLFLYGTCKIPLFELLRQGRGSVVRAKECEMCDPDTGDFKGALQVIMSNTGRLPSVTEEESKIRGESSMSPQKSRVQPSQGEDKKSKYKKVVKSRPMDLTKMQETNNTTNMAATHENFNKTVMSQMDQSQVSFATMNNADLRKKLRVDRVKKQTMGQVASQASVEDPSQPDWAKYKSLREIEMIRETKKEQVINNVLNDYISGAQQLSVIPGQLEFFNLRVHNPFNQNEVFTIYINDPDEHVLVEKELQVVTDQVEWRHWVMQGKSKKPNTWDCVTKGGDIILKPNDEVEVLFKFLTLRDASTNQNDQVSSELIKKRKIQIVIMQSNRQPYQTIEVNVVPSSAPIDHTFRYYEPQNSHVSLQVPPFIQLNYPGLVALVSRPTATVDINKENSYITVETKTDNAPAITEMTLFLYGDQFKEKLLATCKLEVYALVTLYTKIKAGVQSTQTLALPADNARTVELHSSNPRSIYLPKRALNQTFKIIPQTINHIQICARTYSAFQQRVRIHCTDVQTGELVYAWLMIIDSEKPTITKKHDVICKVNNASLQSLEFTNKLNLRTVFEFASSRPDFVIPKSETVTFEARETKLVDLQFAPQSKYGTADVFLYASDLEQNVVECHLLRVAYLP